MLGALIGLLLLGLITGAIARLFVRSPARLGCLGTIVLGIVGSYVGGTLGALLFDEKFDVRQSRVWVGAVLGSIIVLAIWRAVDRRDSSRR